MAENKKAFVVYTDWKKYIDDLDDAQIGKWTRWMFEYCNDKWKDKDLQIEYPSDATVKMLCLLTKDILKRDLKKYEDKKNRLLKNGKQYRNDIDTKSNKNQTEINTDIGTDIDTEIETVNSNKLLVNSNKVLDKSNINIQDTNVSSVEVKEIILELPTIQSAKGNKYPIYQEDIDKYQSVYLGVNVLNELKKMMLWLDANPKSRKTYQGIPRFINSWLSREQDKASRNNKNTTPKEEVYRPYRGDNDF